MAVPFYDADRQEPLIVTFGEYGVNIGDVALCERVVRALSGTSSIRYQVGQELIEAVRPLFGTVGGRVLDGTVYGVWGEPGRPWDNVVHIPILPDFQRPARAVRLSRPQRGRPLQFTELWLACDPKFGRIDVHKFHDKYRIRTGDQRSYRKAVIEILAARKATSQETLFFYPGDEEV